MKVAATFQVVSVETHLGCNLAGQHPECPASLGVHRYAGLSQTRRLTHAAIVDLVATLYAQYDFRGFLNLSFYNEPTTDLAGVLRIVHDVAAVCPDLPFMLHTNGTRLPLDVAPCGVFDVIWVTDYGGAETPDPDRLAALRRVCGEPTWLKDERPHGVFVTPGELDRRIQVGRYERSKQRPCLLPFKDVAVDAFGHAHLCCYDWRGDVRIGNVLEDGLDAVLTNWAAVVKTLAGPVMTDDAPQRCRECRHQGFLKLARLDPGARDRATRWLTEIHA